MMKNNYRILIIDDEEIILDSCTEILAGGDYEVATATDGTRGLKRLKAFQPDLVFVDLKMPGLSGLEVLEEIHELITIQLIHKKISSLGDFDKERTIHAVRHFTQVDAFLLENAPDHGPAGF